MIIQRAWIKETAKFRFKQRYGMCVGAALLFLLLTDDIPFNFFFGWNGYSNHGGLLKEIWPFIFGFAGIAALVYLFVGLPLRVGNAHFNRCVYNGWHTSVGDIFQRGFDDYGRNLGGMFLMDLLIALWSLLLIVPGIIKSYSYFAAPYILSEFPAVQPLDAITLSRRMTNGYKGDLFLLDLSFIGWNLLSGLTFGLLGIFYVNPYYRTARAGFYEVLKANALNTGAVTWWELTGYPGGEGGRAGY